MNRWSKESLEHYVTLDRRLQNVVDRVLKIYDCKILEGHRTPERQEQLFAKKLTKVKKSKHNKLPSLAVDISPYPVLWPEHATTKKEWMKRYARFYYFAGLIMMAAEEMGISLRWGGDWDRDHEVLEPGQKFDDLVHFEIVED